MLSLKDKRCIPCEGGIDPLKSDAIEAFRQSLHPDWKLKEGKRIERRINFINFNLTMDFANKVAKIAEEEGHHPIMHIGYGICTIELWTHSIEGLSENDFILAAKIDELTKSGK